MDITRTVRNSIIFILFFLPAVEAHSQWNQYCFFPLAQPPVPPPPMWSSSFVDAEFNSKDTGVYIHSEFISPSSGNSATVMQTSNAALSWAMTTTWSNWGGAYVGSGGIYKLPHYNTFFVIKTDQGINYLKQSNDGGLTWQPDVFIGYLLSGFFACDTSVYYSIYGSAVTYYLLKYDHGTKYMQYATFNAIIPIEPYFPDTAVGFLIAKDTALLNHSLILKTTDGGSNWSTVFSDSTINIRKTFFVDTLTGYACGDSGLILKTIDGGINWQYQNSGVSKNLNSIFCKDGLFVLAAGDSGTIIRTTDGGASWTQDQTGTVQNFRKIYIVSDSIGMAMTNGFQYSININETAAVWENMKEPFVVFPNPVSNSINFYLDRNAENQSCDLRVYDNMGKLVCHKSYIIKQGENSLDVSYLSHGVYYLILQFNDRRYGKSIIIN